MRLTAFLALLSSVALADVVLKNAGATVGPVTSINCSPDAGLTCVRDAGSVGTIRCNAASAVEPGCITPSSQTLGGGTKTFSGPVLLTPVAHASLVACSSGLKGQAQACSTHNALVFCDGTNNIELNGTSGTERTLFSVYVNGIPTGQFDANKLGSAAGATVTAISTSWLSGTTSDGGVLTFRITDGSNNCDCAVSCSSPSARTSCSGSCSFAASATLTPQRQAGGCVTDPVAIGNVQVVGTSP